jgi:hypothetical protein
MANHVMVIALGKRWIERMQAGRPALKSAA